MRNFSITILLFTLISCSAGEEMYQVIELDGHGEGISPREIGVSNSFIRYRSDSLLPVDSIEIEEFQVFPLFDQIWYGNETFKLTIDTNYLSQSLDSILGSPNLLTPIIVAAWDDFLERDSIKMDFTMQFSDLGYVKSTVQIQNDPGWHYLSLKDYLFYYADEKLGYYVSDLGNGLYRIDSLNIEPELNDFPNEYYMDLKSEFPEFARLNMPLIVESETSMKYAIRTDGSPPEDTLYWVNLWR